MDLIHQLYVEPGYMTLSYPNIDLETLLNVGIGSTSYYRNESILDMIRIERPSSTWSTSDGFARKGCPYRRLRV